MTDKELIKQEIEKELTVLDKTSVYDTGRASELNHLLLFIDSLPEEHNEDFEEEYDNYFKKHEMDIVLNPYTNCKDIARHFAEWQEKKMLGIAEAFYQQGRYEQEQEMMKDAVELHIVESFNPVGTENEKPHGFTALCYNAEYPDFYPVTGQTIKVIPIKEIQQ